MIFGIKGKQIKTKTLPIKKTHIVRYDNNRNIKDIRTLHLSGPFEWGHTRPDKRGFTVLVFKLTLTKTLHLKSVLEVEEMLYAYVENLI